MELRVRVLGRFTLEHSAGCIEVPRSQAYLAAYLALHHGRLMSRERVAGALWPELPEDRARANLSTVAWRLRQSLVPLHLESTVIEADSDTIGFNQMLCNVDWDEFSRAALSQGRSIHSLEVISRAVRALELYRGDLLEDWDVEWCWSERERARRKYIETAAAVAGWFETRGRFDVALRYAQLAVEREPLDDASQRLVIRLLASTGNRSSALVHFRRFSRLAKTELGVDPDAQTIALVRSLDQPTGYPPMRHPSPSVLDRTDRLEHVPLVGRDRERTDTLEFVLAALSGRGGGMVIKGEAGVGKSRLAAWIVEEWVARGGRACLGKSIEFNDPMPYQPLLDALGRHVDISEFPVPSGPEQDRLGSAFTAYVGPLIEAGGRATIRSIDRLRFFDWLRTRVTEIATEAPLLLVLEDLQWADAGTIDFANYLMVRARGCRIALVLTVRHPYQRPDSLVGLERLEDHALKVLALGPMSEPESRDLVLALCPRLAASSEFLQWILLETEGNPLFIVETLRLMEQRGDLPPPPRSAQSGGAAFQGTGALDITPVRIRSALRQRFAFLSREAIRIAGIASVIGRSFAEDFLEAACGMNPNKFSKALRELLQSGVLQREPGMLRFSHDKIRALCYQDLSSREQRSYHSRCAALLTQDPDAKAHGLAWHQESAHQWALAADSWLKAGDQDEGIHAHDEAARAYQRSLGCLKRDRSRDREANGFSEFSTLVKLDSVLAKLGKPGERRDIQAQMAGLCSHLRDTGLELTLALRRADLEDHVGNFKIAARLAGRAWLLARSEGRLRTEVDALRMLAWVLTRSGRNGRARAVYAVALRKADQLEASIRAAILSETALVQIKAGDYPSADRSIGRAKRLLPVGHKTQEHPYLCIAEAFVQRRRGEVRSAQHNLDEARRFFKARGDYLNAERAGFQLSTLSALGGDLGNALRGLRQAMNAARRAGYLRLLAACQNEIAYGIARQIGNLRWAWGASESAVALSETFGNDHLAAIYMDSQVQLLIDEGRLREAMCLVTTVLDTLQPDLASTSQYFESLARRGVIWLGMGDHLKAVDDLEAARNAQTRMDDLLALVDTLTHLAVAYHRAGSLNSALETSYHAIRVLERIGCANHQPQRVFWNHYLIARAAGRENALVSLRRAVELLASQASSLSNAQRIRFRSRVQLNHEILEEWSRAVVRPGSPDAPV